MIPDRVIELILEARSDHNDGWTKEIYRRRLREIKEPEIKKFIDSAMRREKGNDDCEYYI